MKYATAGQEFHVFVFNTSGRVTGWEVMVSAYLSKDCGTRELLSDLVPTEITIDGSPSGEYIFDLTELDTTAGDMTFSVEVPEPLLDYRGDFLIGHDGRGLAQPWVTPTKFGVGTPSNTIYPTRQYEIYEKLYGAAP